MKCTVKNLETKELKKYFGISMSVKKNDNFLSFEISNKKFKSIVENDAESIMKTWNIDIDDISESNDLPETPLKCVLYKGEEFVKKILSYFGDTVNMVFNWDDDLEALKSLELYKLDKNGRKNLSIVVVCAAKENYKDFEEEAVEKIFYPKENDIIDFKLKEKQLKSIQKLSEISSNPEQLNDYIKIYSEDGVIKATDKIFDKIISDDSDVEINENIEIDKDLFSSIELDDYDVYLNRVSEENNILRFESKDKNVITSIMLLTETVDDFDDDIFEDDNLFD